MQINFYNLKEYIVGLKVDKFKEEELQQLILDNFKEVTDLNVALVWAGTLVEGKVLTKNKKGLYTKELKFTYKELQQQEVSTVK